MNIYQIQQSLISIFDEIEENGGELTPELERLLQITEADFKDKVKSYAEVIKLLESDIDAIKQEQKRLKDLADRKQKVIENLNNILISAIEQFGDIKKTGVKYLDYGTGIVSIRQTKAVSVNDEVLKSIACAIDDTILYNKENNQLDAIDRLNIDDITSILEGIAIDDDVLHTKLEVNVRIPVSDIVKSNGYNVVRELAKYTDNFSLTPVVSKSEIKKELEENGACAPNLAHITINKSIQIK
ncbi:MAG: siphovirus Gp157 family protein [Acholeplasmatales bacterium]|nr:siphovirus Gp157 family protein [Methanobrevibacter sp.]MBP5446458.1 siphovirus Gp157 family protein [Acholeplasmatales bacterium]